MIVFEHMQELLPRTVDRKQKCFLMSHHGTFLAYHITAKKVFLSQAAFNQGIVRPIVASVLNNTATLHYNVGEVYVQVNLRNIQELTTDYAVVITGDNTIALHTRFDNADHYLRGLPNYEVDMNALNVGNWERFIAIPLDVSYLMMQLRDKGSDDQAPSIMPDDPVLSWLPNEGTQQPTSQAQTVSWWRRMLMNRF